MHRLLLILLIPKNSRNPIPYIQCPKYNEKLCPNRMQPVGACVSDQCGTGFTCIDGLCCNSQYLSILPRCSDGSNAVSLCLSGRCGQGYICSIGNLCCRNGNGINYGNYGPDGLPTTIATTTIRSTTSLTTTISTPSMTISTTSMTTSTTSTTTTTTSTTGPTTS
uniref:CC domain-containing protein n=1 Tax=Acrobeloides nanus TaxID=290746 RepID=A0A914D586_9BILA